MDSTDEGKIYVGGMSWNTDESLLREYFSNFGEVSHVNVVRHKPTGHSKGFGFVVFSDPAVIDMVLQDKHQIDHREVVVKRKTPREEHNLAKRIFVVHLSPSLTSEEFQAYFETYGPVSDAVIMTHQATQRPRGFGFVSFDSEDSVDRVLRETFHNLNGNRVEVRRALPKDADPGVSSGGGGAGGAVGGAFGYGYGSNSVGYGGFGGYGYPPYGASGYRGRSYGVGHCGYCGYGYPPYGVSGYRGRSYGVGHCGYCGYGYPPYGVSGYRGRSYDIGYYGYPAGTPYGGHGILGAGPRSSWGAQVEYRNAAPEGGSGPGSAVMEQVGGSAVDDTTNGTPPAYGARDGSGGDHTDASNDSGGYENHQANNGQDAMVEVVEKMGKLNNSD